MKNENKMPDVMHCKEQKPKIMAFSTKRIARLSAVIMAATAVSISLASCTAKEVKEEPLTMYVGLGNVGGDYYPRLHDMILENTGIDVKFVYNNTMDTSNAMVNKLKHQDLPADIIVTASGVPEDVQKQSLLDLASNTNLPDLFNSTKMQQAAVDGGIYQIPYCTRLIGVEYNKTLLKEHGWELPRNFEEMVELKKKADAAGVPFAISGGAATGHGFNYLFHLMGSEYLSSADGTQWFEKFLRGETDVSNFAKEAEYFKKYAEAGLFGTINTKDWSAKDEFADKRAIFYYNILNDAYTDDYGKEDGSGDEYASMPWLSEEGSSNCFTAYDSVYLALDKKLGEKGQEEKLAKAVRVLEYMTDPAVTQLFLQTSPDGFVSVKDFHMDESRLYYDEAEDIRKGYLMPWYYNSFRPNVIVNVGQKVNDYLTGSKDTTFEDIMTTLQEETEKQVAGKGNIITDVKEDMDYKNAAGLQAAGMGMAMQDALDAAGVNAVVQAALLPYTESLDDLKLYTPLPVVQEKIYKGNIEEDKIRSYIGSRYNDIVCVEMTGAQIKELVKKGFNAMPDYGHDHIFPYVCMIRNEGDDASKLEDDTGYYVAVSPAVLGQDTYKALEEAGKVVKGADGNIVTATVQNGVEAYLRAHSDITKDNVAWD